MLHVKNRQQISKVQDSKNKRRFSYYRHSICMMLDDTRCGLDASSLHRAASMDISLSKKFRLLSCHLDTSSVARYEAKNKLRKTASQLYYNYRFMKCEGLEDLCCSFCKSNGVSIC